ncbi:SprT family metallopeptidase [Secundilactobacillus pentosiphilus]|uniref:SprT family metallopeptidase n=1 Tax=Secundilactobacillus pentosiphilus TaxID=1714682 RepID=A0A1Z5ING1_9LACO|nr:SprT family protein [Secundilactobacillus pentosiphilus]GAX03275.1 SprT family metallopeptidase [Secundilactobacillus pentosiphilus]
MTDQELQQLVERISRQSFGKPFRHKAVFNGRLRTTGGRYYLQDHHIDINPRMLSVFGEATLEGVIKHELVHYHLHLAGQSGQHRTRAFKQLLRAVGGLRYAPRQPEQAKPVKYLVYRCEKCGQVYRRRRRINTQKFVCGKCHGRLIFQNSVVQ